MMYDEISVSVGVWEEREIPYLKVHFLPLPGGTKRSHVHRPPRTWL